MNQYHIWCDLKEGVKDLAFSKAVAAYMEHLKAEGLIESWRLSRRKLGLGGAGLGEFHVEIQVRDLAQLDQAFSLAATRTGEVERLHKAVYASVSGVKFALYRDFPDSVRQ